MAVNDKSAGPKQGMVVLYNNAGTVKPAMIHAVAAGGAAVSLVFFDATPATAVASSNFDQNNPPATGKWTYTDFF